MFVTDARVNGKSIGLGFHRPTLRSNILVMSDTINSTRIVSPPEGFALRTEDRMFEKFQQVSRLLAPDRCTGVTDHVFPAREYVVARAPLFFESTPRLRMRQKTIN